MGKYSAWTVDISDSGSREFPWVSVFSHHLKEKGLVFLVYDFRGKISEISKRLPSMFVAVQRTAVVYLISERYVFDDIFQIKIIEYFNI